MIKATFKTAGTVATGTVVGLTFDQADARRHLLTPVGETHSSAKDKRVLSFEANQGLYFKAGEEISVSGEVDRHLQGALGLSDEDVERARSGKKGKAKAGTADKIDVDAIRAEGVKAGRAEMLAEVEKRNDLFEAAAKAEDAVTSAQTALEAETDAEKRKPLQVALTKAQEDLDAAEKVVADLPKLEA